VDFGQALQSWHDFYLTTAAVSATLAGLLFVGLSLHIRVVVNQNDVRTLARITLMDFFVVLIVSLFALVPTTQAGNVAVELVIIAGVSLLLAVPVIRIAIDQRRARIIKVRTQLIRFGLSLLSYVVVGGVGVLLFLGSSRDALGWLVGGVVTLLVVAVRNTWDLLVTVGEKAN